MRFRRRKQPDETPSRQLSAPIRQAIEHAVDDAVDEAVEQERPIGTAASSPSGLGMPGVPLNTHSPFYVGFVGAVGVLLAWQLVHVLTLLSSVLLLLAVSLFLALGLDPVVQWIQARGVRRSHASALVFVLVVLLFVGVVALLVPPVVNQASELANQTPDFVQNLLKNPTVKRLDDQYGIVTRAKTELQQRITDQSLWTSVFGGVLGAGKAVVSGLFSAFTVLVLTLYFTASLPRVKASLYRMVPRTRRQRVSFLAEEISRRVGGYFLGQLAVATVNALLSYVMMKLVGVPYSAVLAVSVGILGLIPMVGATLGAVLVLLVALFHSGTAALIVAVYYLIYQQLENYVVAPRVMQRTVAVPGAVTVVAALAGGTLLGVPGALMAIPVAAGLLLVYQEVLLPRQQAH